MAATPGSAAKLNKLKGIARITNITSSDLSGELGNKTLVAGILLKFEDGKIYLTDGVTAIKSLSPIVDKALTAAEKTALSAAFSTGSYVAAANGVVAHGPDGKIDDGSLKVVDGGLIADSYLTKYFSEGKIKLEVLPDTARGGITYVADINARDLATDEQKKGLIFVIDATADSTVNAGSAIYAWSENQWVKIAEHESLDIDVAALTPNYDNVQAAGAVMYDHPVVLESPTLTELSALIEAM